MVGNKVNYDWLQTASSLAALMICAWMDPTTSRLAAHACVSRWALAADQACVVGSLPCSACACARRCFTSHVQSPMLHSLSASCASRLHIIFSSFQGAQLAEKLGTYTLFLIQVCMNECMKHTYCFSFMHNTFEYMVHNSQEHTAWIHETHTHAHFNFCSYVNTWACICLSCCERASAICCCASRAHVLCLQTAERASVAYHLSLVSPKDSLVHCALRYNLCFSE